MKCHVCGNESGKYPLCRVCNIKKEQGQIIKCDKCGRWHYAAQSCDIQAEYLYEAKNKLISESEAAFFAAVKSVLPEGYTVFPQINLATFIGCTDHGRYHNELFRNVDFLITDTDYKPKIVLEINDRTHLSPERKARDIRVKHICEEAGIPTVTLWTDYGVNVEYIKEKIEQTISSLPITRVRHSEGFSDSPSDLQASAKKPISPDAFVQPGSKKGCYIATCVYGSYDCPQVWTLRRYRDKNLARTRFGRMFIRIYYTVSPVLVHWFGQKRWFTTIWKKALDKMVSRLNDCGIESTRYMDRE